MTTMLVTEAMNLFCGTGDPSASKHLTLAEIKLPDMTEVFADHNAGGGRFGIEIGVGIEKLGATFKLNGDDPALLSQFGLGTRTSEIYTGYASVLDKRTGKSQEMKAVMEGRLGKVAPDAFQRGELKGHEYAINSIMHYELYYDGKEKFYFDFFANTWRVDGVDQNADLNSNLGLG